MINETQILVVYVLPFYDKTLRIDSGAILHEGLGDEFDPDQHRMP